MATLTMPRRGRPPKPPEERKLEIRTSVTSNSYDELCRRAFKRGLKLSEYIRALLEMAIGEGNFPGK